MQPRKATIADLLAIPEEHRRHEVIDRWHPDGYVEILWFDPSLLLKVDRDWNRFDLVLSDN